MSRVTFRDMTAADLDAVMRVEAAAFSHPWSRQLFADSIGSYDCQLLLLDGVQVGHGVVQSILDEAHLLNLTIDPACQGRGLGRQLLEQLMRRAAERGARECFLELRASNLPAYRLYEGFGFNEIGRRRGYYPGSQGREDALVMACSVLD